MSQRSDMEQKLRQKEEQLRSDYRAVFASDSGKRIIEDLAKRCFLRHTTFRNDQNNHSTIFNEGKRAVFLHIQTMMEKGKEVTKDNAQ